MHDHLEWSNPLRRVAIGLAKPNLRSFLICCRPLRYRQWSTIRRMGLVIKRFGHLRRKYYRRSIETFRNVIANPLLRRPTANFLHIRKSGGSAVWNALINKASRDFDVRMHRHEVPLPAIENGFVFFVVRDPISRFESGFYDRQRQGRPKYNKPWTPSESIAFGQFDSPNEIGLALYGADHDMAMQALTGISHVRSSYWDWFIDEDYFRSRIDDILFIGRQENLQTDFRLLCDRLGVNASLPSDPVTAHRNPNTREPLSPVAAENLREWFKDEYSFMKVCEEAKQVVDSRFV